MNPSLLFELETREIVSYGAIALLLALSSGWLVAHRRKAKRRRARLRGSPTIKREELTNRR